MIRSRSNKQQGFTLIELLLSMAFVTFIMIFMITTIIRVMSTYNKGLAVKEISQTARTTLGDMSGVARSTLFTSIIANPTTLAADRVCFGDVSYVWNRRDSNTNRYTDSTRVTMARVDDPTMCTAGPSGYPAVPKNRSTTLLTQNVWVHKVGVALDVGAQVVDLELILSTADNSGTALDLSGPIPRCVGDSEGDFCSVSQFTTTVALKVR